MADQILVVRKIATAQVIKAADIAKHGSVDAARAALAAAAEGGQDNV